MSHNATQEEEYAFHQFPGSTNVGDWLQAQHEQVFVHDEEEFIEASREAPMDSAALLSAMNLLQPCMKESQGIVNSGCSYIEGVDIPPI